MSVEKSSYFLLDTLDINIGARGAGVGLLVQQSYHSRHHSKSAPGCHSLHNPPLTIATRTEVAFQVHAYLAVQ